MVGATSAQACDGTFSSHAIILAGPIHIGTVCWTRSAASSSMYKSGFQGTAALRRRQRALQRGYLVPRCSDGYRYMSIRGDLRQRIKATHASLKLHVAHQDTVGAKFHVARHAIEAARPTTATFEPPAHTPLTVKPTALNTSLRPSRRLQVLLAPLPPLRPRADLIPHRTFLPDHRVRSPFRLHFQGPLWGPRWCSPSSSSRRFLALRARPNKWTIGCKLSYMSYSYSQLDRCN